MPDLTTAILGALAATGRPACPDRAMRLAREIATYGGVDLAAAALANDEVQPLLSDLLSYRAALAELADPRLRVGRLQRQAADLDARAEPQWAEAARFAGRAAFRKLQGEHDLAAVFQRKVQAAERLAETLEAEAFAHRLQSTHLLASLAAREECRAVLNTIAA